MNKFAFDIETVSLNPMTDRILCISLQNVLYSKPTTFYGEDESKILKNFWDSMKNVTHLYGFNSDEFDIPFLIKRSLINKVRICDNFRDIKLIDLRKIVNSFLISYIRFSKGTLRDWAKILDMECTTENGSKMKELYEKKDWEKIVAHCEEDVSVCKALYERCINCGVLKNE